MMKLVKSTDGIVSRYINRRVSTRITMFIVKRGINISPNQMTVISSIIGALSALIYLSNNPLIAGICVQISSIIDGVDGELARILGKTSKFGGFLDSILDRFVDIAVIICISIYLIGYSANIELLTLISTLALSGDLMVSYIHARGEATLGIHPVKIGVRVGFASRDVRLFIIFLGSVVEQFMRGTLLYTLAVIAVISYCYVTVSYTHLTLPTN